MANFPTSAPNLKTDYVDNVDDVMADNQNTPNEEVNAIAGKIGTGASTPTAGLFLQGTGTGTSAWNTLNAPQGFLLNGKIVPSVTSDNLTVALKTLAGTDPSASNPIHIRIGDTVRTITSALATTVPAGFNFYNSGSAELATKEVDYFVYLGLVTADSSIKIGFARIPYATSGADFNDTTGGVNNDKYVRWDATASVLSAGIGAVENIGRFSATLSAGAGYTWSVPTFTSTNLIQRPIFETRRLTSTVNWVGSVSNPSIGNGAIESYYTLVGRELTHRMRLNCGSTTSYGAGNYAFSSPFSYAFENSFTGSGVFYNGTSYPLSVHPNYYFGGAGMTATSPVSASNGTLATNNPATWASGNYIVITIKVFL